MADTAADCSPLLAHLGVTPPLVVGWSAGGPHALAGAAAAPENVDGVLLVASFAPFDAEGLDCVSGTGTQNVALFGAVGQGEAVPLDGRGTDGGGVTGITLPCIV